MLALQLAHRLGGEIINADSRQVYRQMDIGTAKPTADERDLVPHHLLDVCNPDETYSLALFLRQAAHAVQDVRGRGRIPILVGGSGQYVWAFLEGWQVPEVPPNPTLRADLEFQLKRRGIWPLFQLLKAMDPAVAERTDPKNPRRVIRALEVHLSRANRDAGRGVQKGGDVDALVLGLTMNRERLYSIIDQRVESMLERGFLDEVRGLLSRGYPPSLPAMSGVGYQELAAHIAGVSSLEEAVQRIKYRTHAIARRQYSWFRLNDPRIRWLEADGLDLDETIAMAHDYIQSCAKI